MLPILERLPVLSRYAKTRGWYYVISWLHRFTGIWLFIALMVHMYTLSSWQTPNVFITDMKIPVRPIFVFLAWASSLVVGFHALNGGRLILYELFGKRNDAAMIRWTFGLSAAYAAMVGLMMIMKNQSVSAFFFWLMTFFFGAVAAYVVASRIWKKRHSILWKLQRISGAFLFITVPAYLFFLYLNPVLADGARTGYRADAERLHPGRHSYSGRLGALSCRVRSLFDRGRLYLLGDNAGRDDGAHHCRHRRACGFGLQAHLVRLTGSATRKPSPVGGGVSQRGITMGKKLQIHSTLTCDVLIIGAGGAGLRCAALLHERRPDLLIFAVTKVAHPQKSHTSTAQGGMAAVDPKDKADKSIYHMFDTWKGGDCTSDQNVVKKIIDGGWEEVQWLERKGIHFSRDEEGSISKRQFGGHTVEFGKGDALRAVFVADRTGKGMMDTAWGEALKGGSLFINSTVVTELLFNEGCCVGAVLFKVKEGEFVTVLAKATVLATGGSGQVFRITTNCRNNTGDGLAVILRAGLPVMDPEAVQFHPTGIVGPGILASEALRSEGGILRNKEMEPFMERYAPKMKDLAPRDIVARAIETEIREGRGIMNPDHQIEHVWIDLRHLPDYVHEVKLKEVASFFKTYANLDSRTQLCPVRPSNHYHMGGIPTNEHGEVQNAANTVVPGLFAVGECACASLHGFNRLGTNSLLELLVMGRYVGERVLSHLKEKQVPAPKGAGEATLALFASYLEAQGKENVGHDPSGDAGVDDPQSGRLSDRKGDAGGNRVPDRVQTAGRQGRHLHEGHEDESGTAGAVGAGQSPRQRDDHRPGRPDEKGIPGGAFPGGLSRTKRRVSVPYARFHDGIRQGQLRETPDRYEHL